MKPKHVLETRHRGDECGRMQTISKERVLFAARSAEYPKNEYKCRVNFPDYCPREPPVFMLGELMPISFLCRNLCFLGFQNFLYYHVCSRAAIGIFDFFPC